jgi:hypothetical protein
MERLEDRTLLSFPPLPISPSVGESQLLQQANRFEELQNWTALAQFPIPYAVVTSHAGGTPVVTKNNPLSPQPMRVNVDVDNNPRTGLGGKDISVQVTPQLFENGTFNPHLLMTIDRLGSAPFASNFQALISFPFSAFNAESLPGDPNLFIGYKTTGADGPDSPGGIAPLREEIRFIPNMLAGANHQVQIQLNTTGASNPLQFIMGHFDGTNLTGILNAGAYAAWVQQPPQNITIGVGVGNSGIFSGAIQKEFHLGWNASSTSKVIFDYLEQEDSALTASDFNTRVTFDQMPTSEQLSLQVDESAGELTLSHRANSVIGKIEILAERKDGLTIIGTLTDVPTEVDLTLGFAGYATLDVNDNTLDMKLEAIKEGGFLNTSGFLGYDIGYASFGLKDAPDLTIGFIPGTDSVGVMATNPGECIGAVELIIGDDAELELPPFQEGLGFAPWDDPNPRHIFSLIDDGTHGTAAVRFVHVEQATFNLDATEIATIFTLITCEAAPFTGYLRTTEDSNLIKDHDIEITMNVNDFPEGNITFFEINAPFEISYEITPPQGIDLIHVFGHIDDTYFDIMGGNLPAVFAFSFDPDGSLSVTADDGDGIFSPGNPGDHIGLLAAVVSNAVHPDGLSGSVKELFGIPIRDARFRLDSIPSFNATWSDTDTATSINFDTVALNAFLGAAQLEVSTHIVPFVHFDFVLPAVHFLRFRDDGGTAQKRLTAGVFGIDRFTYESNDEHATYAVSFRANAARPLIVRLQSAFEGKYFPQFNSNVTFNINNVPQTFDFTADLDPGFRYVASGPVTSILLTGTIDNTNDSVANGTDINFAFNNLPSVVRFSLETGEITVINGLLDINGDGVVNASDNGVAGGIRVIAGRLDTNFDGVITGADDDTFLGANVIDGRLDLNLDGVVDGSDDGAVAGLELKMNGNVNSITLNLTSSNAIFGTPYQLFDAAINTVPAHTLATWAGRRILVETKNASGAPLPLGSVSALLSTDRSAAGIAAKLEPFRTTGPGGARINYSPFLQTIDNRYLNQGGSGSVIPRLNALYNNGQVLNNGEDHIVAHALGDTVDIASLKLSGFQKLLIDPDLDGGTYELRKPVAGVSPLFLGAGLDSTFAMIQFDNIPDLLRLNTNIAGKDITWHTEDDVFDSIGNVDVYVGPAGMAADSDMAARFVMVDVPSDVHIFWDFGFPSGNANFDASNEFGLLFLAQDGNRRLVGALQLEDLQAGYDVSFNPHFDVDWFGPIPTELSLMLVTATVGIDNDTSSSTIAANPAKPGVDGFFGLYSMTSNPGALDPAGPAPGAAQYTPDLTFLMKDFREFSLTLDVGLELLPSFLSPDVEVTSNLVGQFVLDFWAGHVDITAEAFVEFGFRNIADYRDNTPIHMVPLGAPKFRNLVDAVYTFDGFHDFDEHFDPFG